MRAIRTDRKEAASRQAESREKRRRPARFVRHVLTAKTCRYFSSRSATFGVASEKFSEIAFVVCLFFVVFIHPQVCDRTRACFGMINRPMIVS